MPRSISQYVVNRHDAIAGNPLNPETIVLALATIGMLLIALVAVGGFTVLAQRRLRSLGMLGALGATDRNIRLVVRAHGVVVGVAGGTSYPSTPPKVDHGRRRGLATMSSGSCQTAPNGPGIGVH